MSERATDSEMDELQPIIRALADLLAPQITRSIAQLTEVKGAVRVLVIPEARVDVIALARFVRDYRAAGERANRVCEGATAP